MDNSFTKKPKMEDLEVTGVSRSGRVRKKSSKLMDFESLDEIERQYKKQPVAARKVPTDSPTVLTQDLQPKKDIVQQQKHPLKVHEDINIEDNESQPFGEDANDSNTSDYDAATIPYDNRSNTISTDSLDSEQSDTTADISAGGMDSRDNRGGGIIQTADNGQFQKLLTDSEMAEDRSRQGQNLSHLNQDQMVVKNKRLVIKDGRIMARPSRAQQRKPDKTDRGRSNITTPASVISHLGGSKKGTPQTTSKGFNTNSRNSGSSSQQQVSPKSPVYQLGLPAVGGANNVSTNIQGASPPSKNDHMFKVNGIKPIDVAAHLKLLGESLTIIGERLKEHEGQIAVSGSLSVLLDSLLCALGPLLCLTQQIPELQENCCDMEQLTSTLDNVAFIMPGL